MSKVFFLLLLAAFPVSVFTARPLTFSENLDRLRKCGIAPRKKKIVSGLATEVKAPWAIHSEVFVDGQTGYAYTGVLISSWHAVISHYGVVRGLNNEAGWLKPGTSQLMSAAEVERNCQGGVMELDVGDRVYLKVWHGSQPMNIYVAKAWYLGHCDASKPPDGVILVEYKNTLAETPVCLPTAQNVFSDGYIEKGAKLRVQSIRRYNGRRDQVTVAVVECENGEPDGTLCTTSGVDYSDFGAPLTTLVGNRVTAFAILHQVYQEANLPPAYLSIRDYMSRICRLAGVCQA